MVVEMVVVVSHMAVVVIKGVVVKGITVVIIEVVRKPFLTASLCKG